jgi:hypothetical protein
MQNVVYGRIALFLVGRSNEMNYAMEGDAGHDMDEQTKGKANGQLPMFRRREGFFYLTILSMEWNTSEFLHMAIAIALFPMARQ